MSAWEPLTVDLFRNSLPLDFLSQHDAWAAANSSKEFRMVEIIDETVNRFRNAARSNPRNVISDDVTTVPATGFAFAFAIAAYTLGLEMGVTSTGAVAGVATVNVTVPVSLDRSSAVPMATSSGNTSSAINFMDAMRQQVVRGEVWLREVQAGTLPVLGDTPFGTPSFNRPERRAEGGAGCLRDDGRVVEDP